MVGSLQVELALKLEDDLDLLIQADPDLLVLLGAEGHDRLADRPLDLEPSVTTRDGNLGASPRSAGVRDGRPDPGLQPSDRAAPPSPDGTDGERAEQEMLIDPAQEVVHGRVTSIETNALVDDELAIRIVSA
jgi:hypothetical protein